MRKGKWREIAEAMGVVAIVASLIFVGLQIRQEDEISQLELLDRSSEQQRELRKWITENSSIWSRGCVGAELGEADRVIFQHIVDMYLNQAYLRWRRFTITEFTGADRQYLIDAIAANMHRYPGFRAARAARSAWAAEGRRYDDPYTAEYRQALTDRLAELEVVEPHPDWDPKHCGT